MEDAESFYSCSNEGPGELEQQHQQSSSGEHDISLGEVYEIISEMSFILKDGLAAGVEATAAVVDAAAGAPFATIQDIGEEGSETGVEEGVLLGAADESAAEASSPPRLGLGLGHAAAPANLDGTGTISPHLNPITCEGVPAIDGDRGNHSNSVSELSSKSSCDDGGDERMLADSGANNYSFDSYKYSYNNYRESIRIPDIASNNKSSSSSSSSSSSKKQHAAAAAGGSEESFVFDEPGLNASIDVQANYDFDGAYDEFLEVIGDKNGVYTVDTMLNFRDFKVEDGLGSGGFDTADRRARSRNNSHSTGNNFSNNSNNSIGIGSRYGGSGNNILFSSSRTNNSFSSRNSSAGSILRGSYTTTAAAPADISGISSIYQRLRSADAIALSPPIYTGSEKKLYKYLYNDRGHKVINPEYSGCSNSSSGASNSSANNSYSLLTERDYHNTARGASVTKTSAINRRGATSREQNGARSEARGKSAPDPNPNLKGLKAKSPKTAAASSSSSSKRKSQSYVNDYKKSSPYKASVIKMQEDERDYLKCKLVLLRRIRRIRNMVKSK